MSNAQEMGLVEIRNGSGQVEDLPESIRLSDDIQKVQGIAESAFLKVAVSGSGQLSPWQNQELRNLTLDELPATTDSLLESFRRYQVPDPKLRCFELLVTPELAAFFLKNYNHANRRLSQSQMRKLSAAIKRGEWKYNGQTIIFSQNRLLDGQHRLSSIVHSGIAQLMLVVFGVEEEAFPTIDTNISRTMAAILSARGEKHYNTLAATIPWVFRYDNESVLKMDGMTRAQADQVLIDNPMLRDSTQLCHGRGCVVPPSILAACHTLFCRNAADIPRANEFLDQIIHGLELTKGNPAHTLRQKLVMEKNGGKAKGQGNTIKLNGWYPMALTIKAWNKYRRHQSLHSLRFVPRGEDEDGEEFGEDFPVIGAR